MAVGGAADAHIAGQVEDLGVEPAGAGVIVGERPVQGHLGARHRPQPGLVERVGEVVAGRGQGGHHHQLVAGLPADGRHLQVEPAVARLGPGGAGPAGLGRSADVEPAVVVGPEADVGVQHLVAAAPDRALVDADEADRLVHVGVGGDHLEGALDHQVAMQFQGGRAVLGEGERAAVGDVHAPGPGVAVHGDRPATGDGHLILRAGDAPAPGRGVGPGAGGGRGDLGPGRRGDREQQEEGDQRPEQRPGHHRVHPPHRAPLRT